MKFILPLLAAAAIVCPLSAANADTPDMIGDLIGQVAAKVEPFLDTFGLKATLYHMGVRGIHDHDSLGCKVVPMRTAAVDGINVKRHSVLFIKETVGLPMPDGKLHDGYWFATDVGGGIHPGHDSSRAREGQGGRGRGGHNPAFGKTGGAITMNFKSTCPRGWHCRASLAALSISPARARCVAAGLG